MTADLTLVVMGGLDAGVLQEIGPDTPVVVLTGPIEEIRKLAGLLGTTVRVGPILPGGVAIDLDATVERMLRDNRVRLHALAFTADEKARAAPCAHPPHARRVYFESERAKLSEPRYWRCSACSILGEFPRLGK